MKILINFIVLIAMVIGLIACSDSPTGTSPTSTPAPTSVPVNTTTVVNTPVPENAEGISVVIDSPIKDGACFNLGDTFSLAVYFNKPSNWEGPSGAALIFLIDKINPDGTIHVVDTTGALDFNLNPMGETRRGSFGMVFTAPGGVKKTFGNGDFPYFEFYRNGTGEKSYCFRLPAELKTSPVELHPA